MKFLVIIQARCGATRLPDKVLKMIQGKTCLERMLNRVSRSKMIDEIIIATTINKEDTKIVNLVTSLGYRVFVGSSGDVLDRYYQCAKLIKPEYVIRLTADCPLFDYRVLDEAISELKPDTDYLTELSETFPDGQDIEIMKYSVLEEAWENADMMSEREHVTLYIRNHKDRFKIQDFKCKVGNLNKERWTLDEPKDFELISNVYNYFLPNDDFTMKEVYDYLQSHPDIHSINTMINRNEGLAKSILEDKRIGEGN